MASAAFGRLRSRVFQNRNLNIFTKAAVYKAGNKSCNVIQPSDVRRTAVDLKIQLVDMVINYTKYKRSGCV